MKPPEPYPSNIRARMARATELKHAGKPIDDLPEPPEIQRATGNGGKGRYAVGDVVDGYVLLRKDERKQWVARCRSCDGEVTSF